MLDRASAQYIELPEVTTRTDTRDILAHATRDAEAREDYFLVDIDAHVSEVQFWPEIINLIDNDVIRQMGQAGIERGSSTALLNLAPGTAYQASSGRILHQAGLLEKVDRTDGCHHFTELARRSMDSMGLDYQ